MKNNTPIRTRVLIIGAGPAGLALAVELGQRSIPCLLIERNPRTGFAPRAKTTNVRTREHLRRWGIAQKLREQSPLGVDYPSNIVFVTRLAGHELTRIENGLYCAPGKNPLYSEHAQWIPQYTVEEVLRAHAQSLPSVEIRFNCELTGFEQSDDEVVASVCDVQTGQKQIIHCDYLTGADGARSFVRDAIGAKMEGTYGLSHNYNVVFRAPGLAKAHAHGPAIMFWQINGDVPSIIGPMDSDDKWFFMPTALPKGTRFALEDVPDLIRKATGIDLPYEVLSSDEWTASRLQATHYRKHRVFLVGDSCHLHPPFGGYGMNMGVADSVDLGWKLAAVLQGWGGPMLLDSYETERRPVHAMVLDEAESNHKLLSNHLWRPGLDEDTDEGRSMRANTGAQIAQAKEREFHTLGVMLGYSYSGSPIISPDGTPEPAHDFINYVPTARPGSLAPHAWLHDGSSLYDHFGPNYTLLATGQVDEQVLDQAKADARAANIPLKVLRPAEPVLADLYQSRLILVRPDQHIAWRGNAWPSDAQALLATISGNAAYEPTQAVSPIAAVCD